MPVIFVLSTLKAGVDPKDYECWVRDTDYAFTRSHPNFVSYVVHRVNAIEGDSADAGWRYVERIEIKDAEQHRKDTRLAARQATHRRTLCQVPRPVEEHLHPLRYHRIAGARIMTIELLVLGDSRSSAWSSASSSPRRAASTRSGSPTSASIAKSIPVSLFRGQHDTGQPRALCHRSVRPASGVDRDGDGDRWIRFGQAGGPRPGRRHFGLPPARAGAQQGAARHSRVRCPDQGIAQGRSGGLPRRSRHFNHGSLNSSRSASTFLSMWRVTARSGSAPPVQPPMPRSWKPADRSRR